MEDFFTPSNVIFVLGLLGILFGVYNHFKKPQEDSEKSQIVTDKDLSTKATILAQTEAEGKALLLAQQVQTEKEYTTKRFTDLTDRFAVTDKKIDHLVETVSSMNMNLSNKLTRVETIVGEHMKED